MPSLEFHHPFNALVLPMPYIWILIPVLAATALALASIPAVAAWGLSALPIAIVLGIVAGHLFPVAAKPAKVGRHHQLALVFCQKKLLRLGIILFGFNLNLQDIMAVGWQAFAVDAAMISLILVSGIFIGLRLLRMEPEITVLTAMGSAVCGAAAIMATESVVRAKQQQVTIAVATVVVFGTLALVCYPVIYHFTQVEPGRFGVYIGSTVHEVAQAVAAGESIGPEALQTALVVKLIRVLLLAPVILLLSQWFLRRFQPGDAVGAPIPWPWFVGGFVLTSTFNSVIPLPAAMISTLNILAQICLTLAMTALGLQTHWLAIKTAGIKPLALSLILFLLLLIGGYGVNFLLY